MALGAVLQGFPLTQKPGTVPTYVGGALRFISPFSIWTGCCFGGRGDARAACCLSAPGSTMASRSAARRRNGSNVIFYLALATAVITVIYPMAIFPWAARRSRSATRAAQGKIAML